MYMKSPKILESKKVSTFAKNLHFHSRFSGLAYTKCIIY